ncbi:MAG TPA: 5-(carboxyamino)imidazole ribonucleotide mutase, partial [Methylophilaceae bacterium]|nr:5-(carboxyamino)imidazole ribonucleotide mutase [Methylophilaceae bacterium]
MENKQVQHHTALVAIVMGSDSDWPVMKHAAQMLADFGVSYEAKVVSAHRTPDLMFRFAESAASNGYQV